MSSPRYLLDVNLLLALFDPDHVHHDLAHDWFADEGSRAWATCAATVNGFVRILANPAYGAADRRPVHLLERLRTLCAAAGHQYWPETVTLTDDAIFDSTYITSHRHVTDVYLLGLAQHMEGRLATFDRTIPRRAVRDARADLLHVIGPADI